MAAWKNFPDAAVDITSSVQERLPSRLDFKEGSVDRHELPRRALSVPESSVSV